jgi:uncharacterized low-complexity protein
MSEHKKNLKPLSLAIGATFIAGIATSPLANAATNSGNPFAMNDLHSNYVQVAEMKCGSSMNKTSKEGKCGSNKAKTKSATEGKCGSNKAKTKSATEGKCGANK